VTGKPFLVAEEAMMGTGETVLVVAGEAVFVA
jgi:hypothetical protein